MRSSQGMSLELHVRLARASQASRDLIKHGANFGEQLFQGNFEESFSVLKSMGGDLVTIWNRLVVDDEDDDEEHVDENNERE